MFFSYISTSCPLYSNVNGISLSWIKYPFLVLLSFIVYFPKYSSWDFPIPLSSVINVTVSPFFILTVPSGVTISSLAVTVYSTPCNPFSSYLGLVISPSFVLPVNTSPFLNTITLAFCAVSTKSTVIVFWYSGSSGVVASIIKEALISLIVYP